ncbi:MAG: LuxR C-terminal-related transcriptional regulator [Planctomycetota bacterium]
MNEQLAPPPAKKPRLKTPEVGSFVEPYFFFSNDFDSRLTYLSPSVESILGYSRDELLGRKYTEFLDPMSPLNKDVQEYRKRRFKGDERHRQIRVIRDANQRIRILDIQTYGEEDSDGIVVANHGLARDITRMFRIEENIVNQLETLQSDVEELSERESAVLSRVLNGRLNKSIAKELQISERAVERIRARITKKYNAQTTAQLIAKATRINVLEEILANSQAFVDQIDASQDSLDKVPSTIRKS